MLRIFSVCICVFLLFGCGYTPLAHGVKKTLGDKIFVEVKVDLRDSQNSVILKDELSKSIFERLHIDIVSKEESSAIVEVELQQVTFESLAENRAGFATFYRCEVVVLYKYIVGDKVRIFSKKGAHNFSVDGSSVISDSVRLEAINQALIKTLDSFISQVGVELQ